MRTASHEGRGHRIMVSQPGNEKFPIPHTPHPQCPSCAEEDRREMLEQIARAEKTQASKPDEYYFGVKKEVPGSEEELFKKFENLKDKLG